MADTPYRQWAEQFLRLQKFRDDGFGNTPCPFCRDDDDTFSVNVISGWCKCFKPSCEFHAGGWAEDVAAKAGFPLDALPQKPETEKRKKPRTVEYETIFHGLDNKPIMKEIRYKPKSFSLQYHDGTDWQKKVPQGLPRPLLNINQIKRAKPDQPLFIVEGCKPARCGAEHGLLCTTSPQGAESFHLVDKTHLEVLHERKLIVILPDNDDAGEIFEQSVVARLLRHVPDLRTLRLPGLDVGDDLFDWLNQVGKGNTPDKLLKMALQAPKSHMVPTVQVNGRSLKEKTQDALRAIQLKNDPPWFFASEDQLVQFHVPAGQGGENLARLHPITRDSLIGILSQSAVWVRRNKENLTPCHPDKDVAANILAMPSWPFPQVDTVVETPIFSRQGKLLDTPGYHAGEKIIYHPAAGVRVPDVPAKPTPEDLEQAKELLLGELMGEFPFVDQASRAHCVALALGPFARQFFPLAPLTVIEAPTPGTGKGLLTQVLVIPSVGSTDGETRIRLETLTEGKDDADWRTRITSVLKKRPIYVTLDNITKRIDSGSFASLLTSTVWDDRELGFSRMVSVPNRAIWLMTANNPLLSNEISRRAVSVRLDSGVQHPWMRTGFKKEDLRLWAIENRGRLIWACLVIIQHWIASGRKESAVKLGSYERWAHVMGGILEAAGIDGFLVNAMDLYQRVDDESEQWTAFIEAWAERFFCAPVNPAELLELMTSRGLLLGVVSGKTDRGLQTSLGIKLKSMVGRVFGPYTVNRTGHSRTGTSFRLSYDPSKTGAKTDISARGFTCPESSIESAFSGGVCETSGTYSANPPCDHKNDVFSSSSCVGGQKGFTGFTDPSRMPIESGPNGCETSENEVSRGFTGFTPDSGLFDLPF